MISLGGLSALGQQSDPLQEQLQQLRQQYDATTHDLEQRIAALEQQIKDEKEAQHKTKKKIEKLQQQLGTFEFHAYFRSGYGVNSVGGSRSHSRPLGLLQNTAWEMKRKPMRN